MFVPFYIGGFDMAQEWQDIVWDSGERFFDELPSQFMAFTHSVWNELIDFISPYAESFGFELMALVAMIIIASIPFELGLISLSNSSKTEIFSAENDNNEENRNTDAHFFDPEQDQRVNDLHEMVLLGIESPEKYFLIERVMLEHNCGFQEAVNLIERARRFQGP